MTNTALRLQESPARSFKNERRQVPGQIGSGIDADPVLPHDGRVRRRVAVHDDLAEIALRIQELVANPHKIAFLLLIKWCTGTHAGMRKKIIPDCFRELERLEETQMAGGKGLPQRIARL